MSKVAKSYHYLSYQEDTCRINWLRPIDMQY